MLNSGELIGDAVVYFLRLVFEVFDGHGSGVDVFDHLDGGRAAHERRGV